MPRTFVAVHRLHSGPSRQQRVGVVARESEVAQSSPPSSCALSASEWLWLEQCVSSQHARLATTRWAMASISVISLR